MQRLNICFWRLQQMGACFIDRSNVADTFYAHISLLSPFARTHAYISPHSLNSAFNLVAAKSIQTFFTIILKYVIYVGSQVSDFAPDYAKFGKYRSNPIC